VYGQFVANILADYCSLFFVRRWLIFAGTRPIFALCTAPLVGFVIVVLCYSVVTTIMYSYMLDYVRSYFSAIWDPWEAAWYLYKRDGFASYPTVLIVPAFFVHLWLPLFAVGVVIAQLLSAVQLAGRFSQWFFKKGEFHPLRSIGYIAGFVTFLAVAFGMIVFRS
jgi:hypothetical protein